MPSLLPLDFYTRDTTRVAKELLGKILVHVAPNGQRVSGRIVETEAYLGITDRACHTFGNRKTNRTMPLYMSGGHSYVYFIYGMHNCFNIVTQKRDVPEAVLIRALEPLEGIELMRERRPKTKRDIDLTNGPGKLCSALAIDRTCDSILLDGETLFVEDAPKLKPSAFSASPRIGVDYAGEAASWPLRFTVNENPYISKPPQFGAKPKTKARK